MLPITVQKNGKKQGEKNLAVTNESTAGCVAVARLTQRLKSTF